jgi:glycosyltransferase involved in cell wall biosynthesis
MSVNVTIGVCVKNSEKTIQESVGSIINQKYPAELIQVIIVDGCSRDKTMSIVDRTTEETRLKVETCSDKGEGLGTARQIVVNNAKGKYIIFVDADVKLLSDFVRNQVKFMEEKPDIGAVFGTPLHQEGTLIATVWDLVTYSAGGSVGSEATIYRTEVLRQVGGFDTRIKGAAEDIDLIARIKLHGWQVSVNETAKFYHKHKENLRSFWAEQSWFGYGYHYFNHKHGTLGTVWRKFPAGDFILGLKLTSRAYERTHRRLSFLILPQMILGNISWWAGFAKGHKHGYGHEN